MNTIVALQKCKHQHIGKPALTVGVIYKKDEKTFLHINFSWFTACNHQKNERAKTRYRIVKTYLQSDNSVKKIYSIGKYDSLNNLIEKVDYSNDGLIDGIQRFFYDSLNRQILIKTGYPYSTESRFRMIYSYYNDSGLLTKQVKTENYSNDSSICYYEYYPTKKIKLQIINDSIFTQYEYSQQGKLKRIWTSVKNTKEKDKFLPEQIFYGDSLSKTYHTDLDGRNLYLLDSIRRQVKTPHICNMGKELLQGSCIIGRYTPTKHFASINKKTLIQ